MPEPVSSLPNRSSHDLDLLVSVDDALARILSQVSPLPPADVPLLESDGLVLTEDIVAGTDIPPFPNSAMDGYAVRFVDTLDAGQNSPAVLKVIGHIAAGEPARIALEPGTAVRVMTGAALPERADAVVRFEDTDEAFSEPAHFQGPRETIGIFRPAKRLEHVRLAGEDVTRGAVVLSRGAVIRPPEIGLIAALNRGTAPVHRRPRIAILSTGDEIAEIGPEIRLGQIRDSNSYMLATMASRCGAVPVMLGIAKDTLPDLIEKLTLARSMDLIVTSGGVSVGDYDVVKDALRTRGRIDVWQVRMKPGRPLAFGTIDGTPLLGLPGNPVAAAVSFEQFVRPAIKRMLGRSDLHAPTIEAVLEERIENRGQRRHFVRAHVSGNDACGYRVRMAGDQGAGNLTSLCRAIGLLVIPENVETAEPGMRLPVQMIDWFTDLPI